MTNCKEIGEIFKRIGGLFEWIIPNFWSPSINHEDCLRSPPIHFPDSSWYLDLCGFGQRRYKYEGWIGLFVRRADAGSPKIITYTLGIMTIDGFITFQKTRLFDRRDASSGEPMLLKRKTDTYRSPIHLPTVRIMFQINNYSLASLQETPYSVSCAIQTEFPNSVSCELQTEIPDSVSCEIQTEIPDSVSCAIQTVPDSVIHKENSEDEDGLSLDRKEVIILRDCMNELFVKGSNYDVAICVQGKEFRAHRNILSARSPVFAMMLIHDTKENNTGTINIEDCDPDTFHEFLLYVYSARMENLTPSKALQLYYTADKYDLPILKQRCVSLLKTSLSITSICDVVLLAAKHREKELLEVASEFFARNMEEILVSVSWQTFMIQNPVEANELYIKSMKILLPRKCSKKNQVPERLRVPKVKYSSKPYYPE